MSDKFNEMFISCIDNKKHVNGVNRVNRVNRVKQSSNTYNVNIDPQNVVWSSLVMQFVPDLLMHDQQHYFRIFIDDSIVQRAETETPLCDVIVWLSTLFGEADGTVHIPDKYIHSKLGQTFNNIFLDTKSSLRGQRAYQFPLLSHKTQKLPGICAFNAYQGTLTTTLRTIFFYLIGTKHEPIDHEKEDTSMTAATFIKALHAESKREVDVFVEDSHMPLVTDEEAQESNDKIIDNVLSIRQQGVRLHKIDHRTYKDEIDLSERLNWLFYTLTPAKPLVTSPKSQQRYLDAYVTTDGKTADKMRVALHSAVYHRKITKQFERIPEQYISFILFTLRDVLWQQFIKQFDEETPALVQKLMGYATYSQDTKISNKEKIKVEDSLQATWSDFGQHVIYMSRIVMDMYSLGRQLRSFTATTKFGSNVIVVGGNHVLNYVHWLHILGATISLFPNTNIYPTCKEDLQVDIRTD